MNIKQEKTYTAHIYVGKRVAYSKTILPITLAEKYLHEYADKIGLCVTIVDTKYIYTSNRMTEQIDGEEPGFIVGMINYPLYPETPESIQTKAREIATALKGLYQQQKVTIVFPDITETIQ